MKTFATLAFSFSSLLALAGVAAAAPVFDNPGPLPGTPLPGTPLPAKCAPAASAEKVFSKDIAGAGGVAVGVNFKPYIKADCDKLAVGMPVGVYGKLGPLSIDAFSVRLEAAHTKANKNKLDIGFYALNKKIFEHKIAETTQALSYNETHDLTLLKLAHTWTPSYSVAGLSFTMNVGVAAESTGAAWTLAEVGPTGVAARLMAVGKTEGKANVNGIIETSIGDINVKVADLKVEVYRLLASGRALLQPKNGQWEADAGYMVMLQDILYGKYSVDLPIVGEYTLFGRDGILEWGDEWEYNKLFNKQF